MPFCPGNLIFCAVGHLPFVHNLLPSVSINTRLNCIMDSFNTSPVTSSPDAIYGTYSTDFSFGFDDTLPLEDYSTYLRVVSTDEPSFVAHLPTLLSAEPKVTKIIVTTTSAKDSRLTEQKSVFHNTTLFLEFLRARTFQDTLDIYMEDVLGNSWNLSTHFTATTNIPPKVRAWNDTPWLTAQSREESLSPDMIPGSCLCALDVITAKAAVRAKAKINRESKKVIQQKLAKKKEREAYLEAKTQRNHKWRELDRAKTLCKNLRAQDDEVCEAICSTIGNALQLPNTITNTCTKAQTMLDSVTALIEKITAMFGSVEGYDLIGIGAGIASLICALQKKHYLAGGLALITLARQLKIDIHGWMDLLCKHVKSIATNMTRPHVSKDASSFIARQDLQAQSFEIISSLGDPMMAVGTILITGISLLMGGAKSDYAGVSRHLADFGRAAMGWTKITELATWVIRFIKNAYLQYTQGKTLDEVEMDAKYPDLPPLLKRCEILLGDDFKMSYLDSSVPLCKQVTKLENDLMECKVTAYRSKQTDLSSILTHKEIKLKSTFEAARNSCAHANVNRAEPAALYIYGKAGVGKTNLVRYIKAEIFEKHVPKNGPWHFNNCSFTRNVNATYWDGYVADVPIVIYDDMLQQKDSTSLPNPEIAEFIHIKNESAYHLHMSSIPDKKNCYFTSKWILATSNIKTPVPVSITEKDAFYRRWDVSCEIKVNPKYGVKVGDYYKIDTNLFNQANSGFEKDVYLIDVYDMKAGTIVQADMKLDAFMDFFFRKAEAVQATSQRLLASILTAAGIETHVDDEDFKRFVDKMDNPIPEVIKKEPEVTDLLMSVRMCVQPDVVAPPCTTFAEHTMRAAQIATEVAAGTFKDASELVGSASDWVISRAVILHDSPEVQGVYAYVSSKAATVIATAKNFGSWLYHAVCSAEFTNHMMSLCHLVIILGGTKIALDWLFPSKCKRLATDTFLDLCNISSCDCSQCGGFIPHSVGTVGYGMRSIDLLIEKNLEEPHLIKKWLSWRAASEAEFKDEISISHINAASRTLAKLDLSAESKETATRGAHKQLRTESREINTRASPKAFRTELTESKVFEVFGGKTTMKAQAKDQVMLEQWESVTNKNAVTLSTERIEAGVTIRASVQGVFITGRTLLTVNHFMNRVKMGGSMRVAPLANTQGNLIDIAHCKITQCTEKDGNITDLCLVTIPDSISRPCILNKFVSSTDMCKIDEGDYVLAGIRKCGDSPAIFTFSGEKIEVQTRIAYTNDQVEETINVGALYDVNTRSGDCGALLYARNSFFKGKIFGMHVAGNDRGIGCSHLLSREFMDRNLATHIHNFNLSSRMYVDGRVPFSGQMRNIEIQDAKPVKSYTALGNCVSLGMLPMPFAATKTQLRPSLISGTLQTPVTKPAHLRPTQLPNGTFCNPMQNGMKKVLNTTVPVDLELLEIVSDDVFSCHAAHESTDRSILSFEDAITGVENSQYLTPLNRTSSAGYPFCLEKGTCGKRTWLGYGEYVMDEEVRKDVEDLKEMCLQNRRGDVAWMAVLKDERRDIHKVDEGKTRLFAAGPMHYTILVRQYFLRFVDHLMTNKISNEIGVGTNVHSIDWHRTGVQLTKYGKHVIAGDFSNFDGSLLQPFLWEICDMINQWYDDGPDNARIRNVLFEDICCARVLVDGELINWDHSQPSGNPLTVIVNSIFNQMVMRYAYLLCKRNEGLPITCDFTDRVSMQTYGDDNVLNISELVIGWYNQLTITDALSTIGLTYTDEGKTGILVPSRNLSDIAYLKRTFVVDRNGFFQPPLDITVCKEMTNWIRGMKGTGKAETLENVEASIRELYYHGKEVFDQNRLALQAALRLEGIKCRLPTYVEMKSTYDTSYFGN